MKTLTGFALLACFLAIGSVQAQPADPASDASVRKLLDVMHGPKMMDDIMTQMMAVMHRSVLQAIGHPLDAQEQQILNRYLDQMTSVMRNQMSWDKVEPSLVAIYRKNLTEKDVEDMVAFYQTPTGQDVIAKMPEVMREGSQVGMARAEGALPQLQQIGQQLTQELKRYDATKNAAGASPSGRSP